MSYSYGFSPLYANTVPFIQRTNLITDFFCFFFQMKSAKPMDDSHEFLFLMAYSHILFSSLLSCPTLLHPSFLDNSEILELVFELPNYVNIYGTQHLNAFGPGQRPVSVKAWPVQRSVQRQVPAPSSHGM
ncbi:hypothetical protein FRC14_002695 [Serendipita sp. 396]|nr:hypothetical protein FRC14_002695 [Serendipita sp. 396]KAG8789758.1 hypothetical protein FRC15_003827 [Serendipita sp. 397]KAG8804297.1 hypothetical protein FRC16_010626 [Serendipita sp. 398]KAG8809649.1 hypothetical protein FRC19_005099 [Serendipita sp. 401]KAG8877470.1 hypothetical protein FRC20_011139 [Serendipita sp. 405]KAG9046923.1 hypothetical protein FS842_000761 [Serendipita sp. 407]